MTNSRTTAGSGCGVREKGDNHTPLFVVEDKTTTHRGYRVTQAVLAKVEADARKSDGKFPALALHFVRPDGLVSQDWVCMPAKVAALLLSALNIEIEATTETVVERVGPGPTDTRTHHMPSGAKATLHYGRRRAPDPR